MNMWDGNFGGSGNYRPGVLEETDGLSIADLIESPFLGVEPWNPLRWAWRYSHQYEEAPVRQFTDEEIRDHERRLREDD